MKKIKFTLFLYFAILTFSILVQSCYNCDRKIMDLPTLWVTGTPTNVIQDSSTVIIRGEFSLETIASLEVANLYSNAGIIPTANAFGCGGYHIVNPINESSIRISCDKDFKYENSDIIANSRFQDFVNIAIFDFDEGGFFIEFDSAFISKAEFQNDLYTFKIQSQTTDGLFFENQITLQMDL